MGFKMKFAYMMHDQNAKPINASMLLISQILNQKKIIKSI